MASTLCRRQAELRVPAEVRDDADKMLSVAAQLRQLMFTFGLQRKENFAVNIRKLSLALVINHSKDR